MRLRHFRLPAFSALPKRPRRRWPRRFRGTVGRPRVLLPAALLAVLGGLVPVSLVMAQPTLRLHGLPGDGLVGKQGLSHLELRIDAAGAEPADVQVRVDGDRVRPESRQSMLVVNLEDLADGRHVVRVTAESAFGLARATEERRIQVDTKAPTFDAPGRVWASSFSEPFTFEGTVEKASHLTAGGDPVQLHGDAFDVRVESPPARLQLTASDRAGNVTRATVQVGVEHPGMRAVHMTAVSWTSDALREPILDMIRQGKIDTVELDIKDESGHVGYNSDVELANKINADKGYYNAEKVISKLHELGARVVGRLVCFHDPVLAEAAWKSGNRNRVIQTPGGSAYSGGYGEYAFTNFANEAVRQYNIDLAVEAAELGFDGILFDYIRRPDGHRDTMVFPGLSEETTPSESITSFVEESAQAIHEAGAFVGASVFGVAATRPKSVAQDIPQMAKYVDYISPMVYPSHWGPGEYGVADPNSHPYAIVKRSLEDFEAAVEGTNAVVIPWLQDFSLGVAYGPEQVRAQIEAARDAGIDSFLLWNAGASYTPAALDADQ